MAEKKTHFAEEDKTVADAKDEVVTASIVAAIAKGANPNWIVESFSVKPGTELGENYMSVIYSVSISISCEKSGKKDTLDVMLKTTPRNVMRAHLLRQTQAFVKETKMYLEILPALVAFQEERGLSNETIYKPFPACYSAFLSSDGTMDYIALQDLRTENYGILPRRDGVGLEECKTVMRALAKFHALSFAKFEGDSKQILSSYPYLYFDEVPDALKFLLKKTIQQEVKMIRDKSPSEHVAANAMETLFGEIDFFDRLYRLATSQHPTTNSAVITHGDSWTNNFLFYKGTDSQSESMPKIKFVDFQMSRVAVRSLDIGYFLYTSPQIDVLNNHEEDLLRVYYDEFQKFLTTLGYINSKYTFEELCDEFTEYRLFGITFGCMLAPVISAQSGDIPDTLISADSNETYFGNMTKEMATHNKVLNIAKIHIPKLKK